MNKNKDYFIHKKNGCVLVHGCGVCVCVCVCVCMCVHLFFHVDVVGWCGVYIIVKSFKYFDSLSWGFWLVSLSWD